MSSERKTRRSGGFPLTPIPIVKSTISQKREVLSDINMKGGGIGLVDMRLKGDVGKSDVLPNDSGLDRCNREQQQYYEQNWKSILNPKMTKHLRGSKDVLHGGRSLNMLFDAQPNDNLYRESLDWDIFSRKPKKTAQKIERQLDASMGCDICETVHVPIPLMPGKQPSKAESGNLYRVTTPATKKDAEVDIMERPEKIDTVRYKNIYHESLEGQYEKARRGLLVPMRSFKSGIDKQRINEYWRRQGKRRGKL